MNDLDFAIQEKAPRAFELLERLVSEESTVGQEGSAQEILAIELAAAGFDITRLEIPEKIGLDLAAGVPSQSYAGRYDLIGQRGESNSGRTLIINGHMDVVPAQDTSAWTVAPFTPTRRDGWLIGRGAGDMKAGFVTGLLAIWALDELSPGWMTGGLTVVSVIEEECTGNGTLAAGRAGYLADAALLLEPTNLDVLLAGISIIWIEIEIVGLSGHAEAAQKSINPILAAIPVIDALLGLEKEMNEAHSQGVDADLTFKEIAHPYNVNIGKFHAGDWASSIPSVSRLEIRVAHPQSWTSDEAYLQVQAAISRVATEDEWLTLHPPRLTMTGYRAERYAQDPTGEIVTLLSAAHAQAHGENPNLVSIGSTTDARFYLNQFNMPAIAYGPRSRNIHGADEAVELKSIIDAARTVARFLASWYQIERKP